MNFALIKDDNDILQQRKRVLITRDRSRVSIPHERTFLMEFDFTLKSFLQLIKTDSRHLFLFLNKQMFKSIKLEKLKELLSPSVFINFFKTNSFFVSATEITLNCSRPKLVCEPRPLSPELLLSHLRNILGTEAKIESIFKERNLENASLSKLCKRFISEKVVSLLNPVAWVNSLCPALNGLGKCETNLENQKKLDGLLRFLSSEKVLRVEDVQKKVRFSLKVLDKEQFQKYLKEHPSLKYILESNFDYKAKARSFVVREIFKSEEPRSHLKTQKRKNVRSKVVSEESSNLNMQTSKNERGPFAKNSLTVEDLKRESLAWFPSVMLGRQTSFNLFTKQKMSFEFLKRPRQPEPQAKTGSNFVRVFSEDIVINQEFLAQVCGDGSDEQNGNGDSKESENERSSCKLSMGQYVVEMREFLKNDRCLMGRIGAMVKKVPEGFLETNRLEYLISRLNHMKNRKIIAFGKEERVVYLFQRKSRFYSLCGEMMRNSRFEKVCFREEIETLEELKEGPRKKPFISEKLVKKRNVLYVNQFCQINISNKF